MFLPFAGVPVAGAPPFTVEPLELRQHLSRPHAPFDLHTVGQLPDGRYLRAGSFFDFHTDAFAGVDVDNLYLERRLPNGKLDRTFADRGIFRGDYDFTTDDFSFGEKLIDVDADGDVIIFGRAGGFDAFHFLAPDGSIKASATDYSNFVDPISNIDLDLGLLAADEQALGRLAQDTQQGLLVLAALKADQRSAEAHSRA